MRPNFEIEFGSDQITRNFRMSHNAGEAACKYCVAGEVMDGTPQGTMSELGGIEYYLGGQATSGGAEATGAAEGATKAIVFCHDIFGMSVNNPKLIADALTKATSLPVYVPDYLQGDYVDPSKLPLVESPVAHKPLVERVMILAKTLFSFMYHTGPTFIYRHRAAVTVPIVEKVSIRFFLCSLVSTEIVSIQFCTALRGQGITRIGAVGYCLGGDVTTKLSINDKFVNAAVVAHPGPLGLKDFTNITIPYSLIFASEDPMMDSKKEEVIRVLEGKKDCEHREYAGTVHGFAARPVKADPVVQRA